MQAHGPGRRRPRPAERGAMAEVTASRTLVKSHPELWTECSDAHSLARHLGAFGQIRITSLEPETAVAWEGERASGTVRLEPSGWGTRVVLTATPAPSPSAPQAGTSVPDEPEAAVAGQRRSSVVAESDAAAAAEAGPSVVAQSDATAPPGHPPEGALEPRSRGEPEAATQSVVDASSRVDEVSVRGELPPPQQPPPAQEPRRGLFARLRARWQRRRRVRAGTAPPPVEQPGAVAEAPSVEDCGPVDEPARAADATPDTSASSHRAHEPSLPAAGESPFADESSVSSAKPSPAPLSSGSDAAPARVDPAHALTEALDSLGRAHHRPFSRP